jgi:hypothetical protein
MANKHSELVEFDTELALDDDTNLDVCIGFMRTTIWGRENYGADADGNRGMMMDIVDSDDYTCITVEWQDAGDKGDEPIKYKFPADALPAGIVIEDVYKVIAAYMESHDATGAEEREEDCDDRDEDE